MTLSLLFILLSVILILIWLIEYSKVELYNTIYYGPNNEQVKVIDKNLFTVTISYIGYEPETMFLFDFITNYHTK